MGRFVLVRRLNSRGMSLAEVVVSMGIMSILALGMSSTISHLTKQQTSINRKMEAIQFGDSLNRMLSDNGFCACNFKDMQFPSTIGINEVVAAGNELIADCEGTPRKVLEKGKELLGTNSHLVVGGIGLKNIRSSSGGSIYTADISVNWTVPSGSTQISPTLTSIVMDTVASGSNRKIVSCGSQLADSAMVKATLENQGCTSNQLLGFDSAGTLSCVDPPTVVAASSPPPSGGSSGSGGSSSTMKSCDGYPHLSVRERLCPPMTEGRGITEQCYDGKWKTISKDCMKY